MNKQLLLALAVAVLAAPLAATVSVVTTTEDLAAIAREVGGDRVKVESIARGDEDPHFVNAKPSYMLKLRKADLWVEVGLELEIGWAPLLVQGARNGRIQRGSPGFVDASIGVRTLEVPTVATRAEGDVHPYGNPHYWLDPANGIVIARNIAEGLKRVDPAGREAYEANLRSFAERIQARMAQWQGDLAPYEGAKVVSYHRAWPYFEDRFGIRFVDELEPKPGIPPSPRHIARLTDRMKTEEIGVIVYGPYYNPKPVRELARRVGAEAVPLPLSVGGAQGVETYFDLFDHLVAQMKAGLSGRSGSGR